MKQKKPFEPQMKQQTYYINVEKTQLQQYLNRQLLALQVTGFSPLFYKV